MTEQNAPQEPAAPASKPAGADKKIVAGILAILLGALGIHKFVLGYSKEGIIGLIEGIMYLTKSDEEFVATYINGKKGWF